MSNHKQIVLDFMKGFVSRNPDPLSLTGEPYIQHNLGSQDGKAGFAGLLEHVPAGSVSARIIRIFEDGDFVFTHTEYDFFGPKIGFDIFRFENDLIVEHWDNMQETAKPNVSGHTMIDGPTEAKSGEDSEATKALVENMMNEVFIEGKSEQLAQYVAPDYIQHNPAGSDGLEALQGLAQMMKGNEAMKFIKIHTVLGEGDFALTVSEGVWDGKPTTFYDLFRVENGKIVEHWDVMETLPPKENWKNTNGKFGF